MREIEIYNEDCLSGMSRLEAGSVDLVRTYSDKGDLVLDNCMGSGTTGVACVNTGRRFVGFELDKTYFEIAQGRMEEAEGHVEP